MVTQIGFSLKQIAAVFILPECWCITVFECRTRGGYWKCAASYGGLRVDGDGPTPFAAIARVAVVVVEAQAINQHEAQHRGAASAASAATDETANYDEGRDYEQELAGDFYAQAFH